MMEFDYASEDDGLSLPSSITRPRTIDKENLSSTYTSPVKSSPIKSSIKSPARHDPIQKQKRPPTVTPKRFSRFFTPRSSLSAKNERRSKSSRHLRDITRLAANRAPAQAQQDLLKLDFSEIRPAKRRKRELDLPSSPPQSSPLKAATPSKKIIVFEDDETTASTDDELDEGNRVFPTRIRRLNHGSTTQRLLGRSFGGRETTSQGRAGVDNCSSSLSSTANFYSGPKDVAMFYRGQKALPFTATACNTNSLVAVGDEEGVIHLFDSAPEADFAESHLSFQVHSNAIFHLAFSSHDDILASASGDQTARIIDMQTQKPITVLVGHTATVRQIRFHPNDNKLLTTSGRDGLVNIWDLRCAKTPVKILRSAQVNDDTTAQPTLYPYASMIAGPAHRTSSAAEKIIKLPSDPMALPTQVSITSVEFLHDTRSHLLLTASEQNASLKLFDLRTAGRNSRGASTGYEVPISSTIVPSTHYRNHGVTSLALSSDGSRVYSACRDSTIWTYSTQHLILGSAPEMLNLPKRTRHTLPDKPKDALGPLYGFRHPSLKINSFYVKIALRKASPDSPEVLAAGSREQCAVLFDTDERSLRDTADLRRDGPSTRLRSRGDAMNDDSGMQIYNTGTALIRGHTRDVTSTTFTYGGELVTLGDDYRARCWREDAGVARGLRQGGEGQGNRWSCGWADVAASHDEDEVE